MESTVTTSAQDIQAELERVLGSTPFANAHRSQRFLRYIVECSLKHQDEFLKEFAIAVDVFGRNVSYDPSINATVRVEAGRLRSRLRDYYIGEGCNDPIIIDVPKGGYRANFIRNPLPAEAPASALAHVTSATESISEVPSTASHPRHWTYSSGSLTAGGGRTSRHFGRATPTGDAPFPRQRTRHHLSCCYSSR